MIFYLSGGMEFKANLGMVWREWLTNELGKIGHTTVDPTKLEEDRNLDVPTQTYLTQLKTNGELDKVREITRNTLFRKDMWGIQLSDAMIVLYDVSVQKGAGTLAEAWEGFREGRPMYLVSDFPLAQIPTWLIGESTELFYKFEDFLDYAKDSKRLAQDKEEAKRISHEVLSGLYRRV